MAWLVYDGDCGICEAYATDVRRTLPAWNVVAAGTLDDAHLAALGLSRERCAAELQVVDGHTRASGAAAINAVLVATQHPLAALVRFVETVPALFALERRAYAAFAARRGSISRLLGKRSCGLA
jgi:predicted DCC family thiol-disulfide oxidoreductase YuxK